MVHYVVLWLFVFPCTWFLTPFSYLILSSHSYMFFFLHQRSVDDDQWCKGEKNSLASLVLHQFTSSVGIESNGAMKVTVEMLNCMLDDKRLRKKGKPTRYSDLFCRNSHMHYLYSYVPQASRMCAILLASVCG